MNFHDKLKIKMDCCVRYVYQLTRKFPRDEIYGVTSQLRRATLSIILNYIEGFARGRDKVNLNFLEMSYGSLKENKYLLYFSFKENYINEDEYKKVIVMTDEIGAMLWTTIEGIRNKIDH